MACTASCTEPPAEHSHLKRLHDIQHSMARTASFTAAQSRAPSLCGHHNLPTPVPALCTPQAIDVAFLQHTIAATLASGGHSVQLLFAFEYVILASSVGTTFVKYCLSRADGALEGRWEGKGVAVFYLELMTDMLHLLVYCVFFVIVFTHYGLSLHLVSGVGA